MLQEIVLCESVTVGRGIIQSFRQTGEQTGCVDKDLLTSYQQNESTTCTVCSHP